MHKKFTHLTIMQLQSSYCSHHSSPPPPPPPIPTSDLLVAMGYAKNGHADEAFRIYEQMQQQGVAPERMTFTSVVNVCASLGALGKAKRVHADIMQTGITTDIILENALIYMYAKCGSIKHACEVFEKMQKRDVVSWTALIVGLVENGCGEEALEIFSQMQEDVRVMNALVSMYARCGSLDEAQQVFDNMDIKDVVSWNAMIVGYADHGQYAESFDCGSITSAREVFNKMATRDVISWTVMIRGYTEHGHYQEAFAQVFDSMANRNVISWTAMIGGFSKDGDGEEAFSVFNQMQQEGIVPNTITFISILKLCASTAALLAGKRVHAIINQAGLQADICVGNALVDMYAKCGSIVDAQKVFDKMHERDVVSWNAIITGYAQHGLGEDALQLYNQMQQEGLSPDSTTFVGVLSACSHAGLVYEGLQLFNSMCHDYSIIPTVEHYGCMVDLLGRAGLLNAAEGFIRNMPFEADASIWAAFLGACRIHSNVKLADHAAKILLRTETQNAAVYVQLSNIYAAAGLWDDVEKVRNSMKDRGVKKEPGRTWIELGDQTHSFMIEDRSHPQSEKIYAELDRLGKLIQTAGYVPDTRFVVHDVDEKLKEIALCYHSEKLAIAFGIINMPSGTPIRIIKNLRVCTDCHTFTKFISKITGREIVARDSRRFHHFKNGLCSCGDFW
ncbi:unnamed protein product [Sphagnum troendelagicum]